MSRNTLIDQFHLSVRVPATMPDPEVVAIRQTLSTYEFLTRLRRALRHAIRTDPTLAAVRVTLSR
jgi:hypothetical protein